MIDAIEGTQDYSEPRLSSALAQVMSRRVFDGLNDESASPWAAVSLAAALFVSCFHTGGIRRLISFRDSWCEEDFSTSIRAGHTTAPRHRFRWRERRASEREQNRSYYLKKCLKSNRIAPATTATVRPTKGLMNVTTLESEWMCATTLENKVGEIRITT